MKSISKHLGPQAISVFVLSLPANFSKSKNLFKRAKIRDDFFSTATVFDYYSIVGDDRPDNIASKFYGDAELDWVVLLSNNILNVRDEWPMSQYDLERYLDNKYSAEQLQQIHHYETKELVIHPNEGGGGIRLLDEGLSVLKLLNEIKNKSNE